MSTLNSGIILAQSIVDAVNNSDNTLIISEIRDEAIELIASHNVADPMAEIAKHLSNTACFALFKRQGRWNLLTFVPETSTVKAKMMYASSKSQLVKGSVLS